MPAKKDMDETAVFLYHCLKNCDGKKINFNAVGATLNLKPNTASKRYAGIKTRFEGITSRSNDGGEGEDGAANTELESPKKAIKRKNEAKDKSGKKKIKVEDDAGDDGELRGVEGGEEDEFET